MSGERVKIGVMFLMILLALTRGLECLAFTQIPIDLQGTLFTIKKEQQAKELLKWQNIKTEGIK